MASGTLTGVQVSVATATGRRARNEDAIGMAGWVLAGDPHETARMDLPLRADRPLRIALVDGMGGHPDGDRAAALAARLLTSAEEEDMVALFTKVDKQISAAGNGMGCTAALLSLAATGDAMLANVGDVRVYRLQDGYAGQLSEDHRIEQSIVARCLGGNEPTASRPAIRILHLRRGDRLLMCTDGVHDAVPENVVAAASADDGKTAATRLVQAAIAADHGDNATGMVIDFLRN